MKQRLKPLVYRVALEALHLTGASRLPGLKRPGVGVILTLHHVTPDPVPAFAPNRGLTITPTTLDMCLTRLTARGYDLVSLDEVHRRLAAQDFARPFAAITLDDGYRDNRDHALPVFERHAAPFTVFATPGFCEGRVLLWWEVLERIIGGGASVRFDFGAGAQTLATVGATEKMAVFHRIRSWILASDPVLALRRVAEMAGAAGFDALALTRQLVLDRDELVDFARHPLASIGAHTLSHPNLRLLSPADARREMVESADTLENWLGTRPRHIAYPYGFAAAAGPEQFAMARQTGFALGVTTRPGMLFPEHAAHLSALPRVSINGEFQAARHMDVLLTGAPFALVNRFRRVNAG